MNLQEKFRGKRDQHRPLELTSIRIEVSPAREESVGWTLDEWRKLADDFVRAFDDIDLSEKAKRKSAKFTNVRNSQYVVSLHRDSKKLRTPRKKKGEREDYDQEDLVGLKNSTIEKKLGYLR